MPVYQPAFRARPESPDSASSPPASGVRAGARPASLVEAFDWLSRRRRDIESLAARPAGLRTLASLEPLGLTRNTKRPPPPRGGEGR